jgi:hypothetical protein
MYVIKRKEVKTMMVKVYVDWEERRVLNKKEFEEEVNTLVENINEDHYERRERIWEFLEYKELDWGDLFDMSETDRQELIKEFDEWLVEDAKRKLLEGCFSEAVVEL